MREIPIMTQTSTSLSVWQDQIFQERLVHKCNDNIAEYWEDISDVEEGASGEEVELVSWSINGIGRLNYDNSLGGGLLELNHGEWRLMT